MSVVAFIKRWALMVSLVFGITSYMVFANVPFLVPVGDVVGPFLVDTLPVVLFMLVSLVLSTIHWAFRILALISVLVYLIFMYKLPYVPYDK